MKNEFNCLNLLLFQRLPFIPEGTLQGWLQKGKQEKENDNLMLGGETLSKILSCHEGNKSQDKEGLQKFFMAVANKTIHSYTNYE